MFSILYKYWYNVVDSPSILFKLNLWSFINIRYFKLKFSRVLVYFILGLKSLKVNQIRIFYKDWIFENFYNKFFKFIFFIIILVILL